MCKMDMDVIVIIFHIDRDCCHQTPSKRYGKVFQSMDWDTIKVDSRSTKQQDKSLMPCKSYSVLQ